MPPKMFPQGSSRISKSSPLVFATVPQHLRSGVAVTVGVTVGDGVGVCVSGGGSRVVSCVGVALLGGVVAVGVRVGVFVGIGVDVGDGDGVSVGVGSCVAVTSGVLVGVVGHGITVYVPPVPSSLGVNI
jgi:hypothetical protein